MEYFLTILVSIIVGWVGYKWWMQKRYRSQADTFKELIISDLPNFETEETTLSALVLAHYPVHNKAFNKFLIYVPKSKKNSLVKQWRKYEEIHGFFKSFGIFGVVMAELPHPDFDPNIENVDAVSRKRKKQIVSILKDFIEKL